jgi:leader peptidase (prepilin peptidase) / N-methyltransferase
MAHWIVWPTVFILGTIIGSFLTVCVYRIPRGQSVVSPRSACSHCGNLISWYDNVPIFSFLWLQGRCRVCYTGIPLRYPLIELANGLGWILVFWRFGFTWSTIVYMGLISVFLVVAWIDWDHKIIPDVITLPGIMIGFLCASLLLPTGWGNSLAGILVGGGVLVFIAWLSPFLFGKEGMGGGDIKFLAMVGAFLGWQQAILTLMVASVAGALVGIALLATQVLQKGQYIPFGPYLSLGGVIAVLWGSELWHWYFNGLL